MKKVIPSDNHPNSDPVMVTGESNSEVGEAINYLSSWTEHKLKQCEEHMMHQEFKGRCNEVTSITKVNLALVCNPAFFTDCNHFCNYFLYVKREMQQLLTKVESCMLSIHTNSQLSSTQHNGDTLNNDYVETECPKIAPAERGSCETFIVCLL